MGDWSQGLFGCFDNCGICIITYFVPCVTAGQVAESTGKSCLLYGFLSMLGCIGIYTMAKVREELRATYSIEGSFLNDCLIMWFCAACGLCQEAAQIQGGAAAMAVDAVTTEEASAPPQEMARE